MLRITSSVFACGESTFPKGEGKVCLKALQKISLPLWGRCPEGVDEVSVRRRMLNELRMR